MCCEGRSQLGVSRSAPWAGQNDDEGVGGRGGRRPCRRPGGWADVGGKRPGSPVLGGTVQAAARDVVGGSTGTACGGAGSWRVPLRGALWARRDCDLSHVSHLDAKERGPLSSKEGESRTCYRSPDPGAVSAATPSLRAVPRALEARASVHGVRSVSSWRGAAGAFRGRAFLSPGKTGLADLMGSKDIVF